MITPFLRVLYKTIFLTLLVALFILTSLVVRFIWQEKYRTHQLGINRFFSGLALKLWGVKINLVNAPRVTPQGWLMVSNHFGIIDAFSMIAHFPVNFVTSVEMHETPVLGLITEMGCCFYVERRDRSKIHNEKAELVKALKDGYNIMLYPEGTSGDASSVLPFRRTFMMSAADAGAPLQLICLNFKKINGEPFSHKWRDHVCWYGDLNFAKHCYLMFSLKSIELEVKFIEQLMLRSDENKDEVSKRVHGLVSAHYIPIEVR